MTQNIIALTIVFLAFGYTIYSIIRSLTVKKTTHCSGCSGCSMKDMSANRRVGLIKDSGIQPDRLLLVARRNK